MDKVGMTDHQNDPLVEAAKSYVPGDLSVDESYALYSELQARCPVAHSEKNGGFYLLTRYKDLMDVSNDWETFSSAQGVSVPRDVSQGRLPAIEMDPPEQGAWRRLYLDAVSPAALKALEPSLAPLASSLIDSFAGAGACDLLHDYAEYFPVLGMCQAIGLTDKEPSVILGLAKEFTRVNADNRGEVYGRAGKFILDDLLERRKRPRDDYLTRVALAEIDGRPMDDSQLIRFMIGFLVAGHESTASSLASLLFHALSQPELKERMLVDDKAMAAGIEEAVRLDSPFHGFVRSTTRPVEIEGVQLEEGAAVQLCYAAANRDPAMFERAGEFSLSRAKTVHFGFGRGPHFCAGAPLARLEMRVAFRELFRRLPDLALVRDEGARVFVGPIVAVHSSVRAVFTPR